MKFFNRVLAVFFWKQKGAGMLV